MIVIPAKAGIQLSPPLKRPKLDPGLRRGDGVKGSELCGRPESSFHSKKEFRPASGPAYNGPLHPLEGLIERSI